MKNCYDWNNNLIDFIDTNSTRYSLKLRGNKTIIMGASASGKSLLCTRLHDIIMDRNTGLKPYEANNVFVVNEDNINKLKSIKNKLIIIDRADLLLNKNMIDYINHDSNNRYLIFARKPLGINLSPNYFGRLIKNDNTIEIEYEFNEKGWY